MEKRNAIRPVLKRLYVTYVKLPYGRKWEEKNGKMNLCPFPPSIPYPYQLKVHLPTKANDNAGQEKKRARTFINTSQLSRLMHAYYNMPKPNLIERQRIATEIGLDMRVVQVWFQNRRAKDRRNVNKPLHPMLQQAANRRKKHARSNTWSAGMSRDMEFDKDDDACSGKYTCSTKL